ncbi:MAG: hypothetical protein R6U37_02185 [Dehalococcoidia bacterium]
MEEKLFRGTEPQVLTTNPNDPMEGRIFVWAWTEWFERIEGEWGDVAFTPVATSESDLREWLSRSEKANLFEADSQTAEIVISEFTDQEQLYPEGMEVYDEVDDMREEEGNFEHR